MTGVGFDRARWNRKYAAGEGPAHFEPTGLLLDHAALLSGGRALDAACGFGGNALYLAARGYQVHAVDLSNVALKQARAEAHRRGLQGRIHLLQADLDHWPLPPAYWDVALVFFYLNRGLVARLAGALRPGGFLFQANRNVRYLHVRPDFTPDYLLAIGELRDLAEEAGLEVLHYADGTPGQDWDTQLIARRPG